jgi:hypothetical protein
MVILREMELKAIRIPEDYPELGPVYVISEKENTQLSRKIPAHLCFHSRTS